MDGTPDAIRDVQFREKLRGYHTDDVDAFVQRVADLVASLQAEVAAARASLAALESERRESSDAEESLRRTLVLAQRTADLAIKEAQDEAERMVADANERRTDLLARAVQEQREHSEAAQADLRAELAHLAELRDRLQADTDALHGFLDEERDRVRGVLTEQLERLATGLEPAPKPKLYDIDLPDSDHRPAAGRNGAPDVGREDDSTDDPSAGPPVSDDDAFLAELRLAVTDDEPLGPRDDPLPAVDADIDIDIFEEAGEGGRLGNRLRRRR